ncbi:MAG: hypothetical protein RBU21_14980 [FCB group bacterium]|jgi:hypothetical protein|nr:hypothetical protein [FCB group bacterium]
MKSTAPSPEEWQALYAAADEFRAAESWTWMEEMDLFGVTDPETGEVGYCSIMGGAGEHFAIAVYEGTEGLESLVRLQAMGEAAIESMEAALSQKCIIVSFENRDLLEKEDLAVIKKIGRKYRGKNVWPMFRRMRPFWLPSSIDAHQARFLTLVLPQAIEVAKRFRFEPALLGSPDNPKFLVRNSRPADGELEWFDEYQEAPEFDEPEPIEAYALNDIEAERIRRLPLNPISVETDFILFPGPVHEEEGAYFPYMLMAVESATSTMLTLQTAAPWDYSEKFAKGLIVALENLGARPQEIRVGRPELVELFAELESRCGIPVKLSDDMEALDGLLEGLMGHLGYS